VDRHLATKSEVAGLIVCAISFQDFQPMRSQITNVTDGQSDDMRSQDRANALKCIASKNRPDCIMPNTARRILLLLPKRYINRNYTYYSTEMNTFPLAPCAITFKLHQSIFTNHLLPCKISSVSGTLACLFLRWLDTVLLTELSFLPARRYA